MKQQYEILTAVYYHHTFFPAHGYEGLSISIPPDTGRQLLNRGLLLKPVRDGFLLLYDTHAAGGNRNRTVMLQDGMHLAFHLLLKDHLFYNYTQVNMPADADRLFRFSNGPPNGNLLHKSEWVNEEDMYQSPTAFFVKPFGQLELQLDTSLQDTYYIRFRSKSTRWCYFLMSDNLASLSNPGIIDNNGQVMFDGPEKIKLPGTSKEVPVLISRAPISLVQKAAYTFRLVDYATLDRYRVIIPALPAPDISNVSNAGASRYTNGDDYSEIFLY